MLRTVIYIVKSYFYNEFKPIIVYGAYGYGKSAFAIKVLAEVKVVVDAIKQGRLQLKDLDLPKKKLNAKCRRLGFKACFDIDYLEKWLFFHPQNVVNRLLALRERAVMLVWDDAGYWLNAFDYNHPYIQSVQKYFNVVRSDFACIMFTTPLPTWIVKKLRGMPQTLTIKILKASGNKYQKHLRIARAYRDWVAPDMKHRGVHKEYEDRFDCYLPNDVFDWYTPIRDRYSMEAKLLMKQELKTLREFQVIATQ